MIYYINLRLGSSFDGEFTYYKRMESIDNFYQCQQFNKLQWKKIKKIKIQCFLPDSVKQKFNISLSIFVCTFFIYIGRVNLVMTWVCLYFVPKFFEFLPIFVQLICFFTVVSHTLIPLHLVVPFSRFMLFRRQAKRIVLLNIPYASFRRKMQFFMPSRSKAPFSTNVIVHLVHCNVFRLYVQLPAAT